MPEPTARDTRTATTAVPLHPLLAQRWSPRAFDPHGEMPADQITALLEAARWSPSAANTQPWRFVVARRGTPAFAQVLAALAPGNQVWARNSAVLLVAVAETVDEDGAPRPWAQYDVGQAVAHLSMQAQAEGLVVHQMGGFSADALSSAFGLEERFQPMVVAAIGSHDADLVLPEPLAVREQATRTRLPLAELLVGGEPVALPRSA